MKKARKPARNTLYISWKGYKILPVLTVSCVSLSLHFDFVLLVSSFGLLDVAFATKSELANFEKRSKAFSPVNGERGREIFRFDFNVATSNGASSSRRFTGINWVGDGGEIRPLSSTDDCECPRGFWGTSLKIEVSENERALVLKPGQGTAKRAVSWQLTTLSHSSIAATSAFAS